MADGENRLEERLADWFTAETRRAEHDLRGGLRPRPPRSDAGRRRALALAVVAVTIVALGSAGVRFLADRSGSATSPSGSIAAASSSEGPTTPRPNRTSGVTLGPDGLPSEIDGEPVVRLEGLQAALLDQDATVVAGWVDQPIYRCAEPEWPLIPTCTGRRLSPAEPAGRSGGFSTDLVVGDVAVPFGPVAVRVHTRDPRAESCPPGQRARCSAAFVVDEVLWHDESRPVITGLSPDGIPTDIDGERVIRPSVLATIDGAGPWLVGGWHRDGALTDTPDGEAIKLTDATDRPQGPLIARVEAGDPLVLEDVVWSRDPGAAPAPIDEITAAHAIADAVDPEGRSMALTADPPGKDDCDPGWPPVLWRGAAGATVGLVAIYPSSEEAAEVEGRLLDSGWQGLGCSVTFDALVTWEWVRVENVIVQFNLTLPDGTAAELELIERVTVAVEAAVAGAGAE